MLHTSRGKQKCLPERGGGNTKVQSERKKGPEKQRGKIKSVFWKERVSEREGVEREERTKNKS